MCLILSLKVHNCQTWSKGFKGQSHKGHSLKGQGHHDKIITIAYYEQASMDKEKYWPTLM